MGLLLVAGCAWFLWPRVFKPKVVLNPEGSLFSSLTPASNNRLEDMPCADRERCVVVYLAPWCPACKSVVGMVRQLEERFSQDPEIGFVIIAGRADQTMLDRYVTDVTERGYLDVGEVFWRASGVQGVPHWFTLNGQGEVLTDFGGYSKPLRAQIERLEL